jgi:hypothetical protein
MIQLMAIKSKFFLSKCFKKLTNLISGVLPANHKMSKYMYHYKKFLKALGVPYEKVDVCKDVSYPDFRTNPDASHMCTRIKLHTYEDSVYKTYVTNFII